MKFYYNFLNIIFCLIIFNFHLHPNDLSDKNEFHYVYALSGLNLRLKPDLNSEKIFTIPYLSKVKINSFESNLIFLDNKIGRWTNVTYDNLNGWVFSGYLMIDDPIKLLEIAWNKIYTKNKKIYKASSFKFSIKSLKIKSTLGNLAIITFPGTGLEPGMNSIIDSVWFFDGISWEPLKSNSKIHFSEDLNDSPSHKSIVLSFINDDFIPDLILTESCCGSNYKSDIFLSENLNYQFKKIKTLDNYYLSSINWNNLCGENYFKFISALDGSSIEVNFHCQYKTFNYK